LVRSLPGRLYSLTRSPVLRAMTRKPSCLISCSHSSPEGGCGALIGRHGAMKPGGKVREVSNIRGDWNRRRSRGGQIRGELSAASAFSLNLRRFRRAQCKRPDPPTHSTGRDLPPARSDAGADDHSSHIINLHGLPPGVFSAALSYEGAPLCP